MSRNFELFSDIFAFRDNRLSRLDPRLKLGAALALMAAVLMSGSIHLPLAVFASCAAVMLIMRFPPGIVLGRFVIPLLMALVICVMQTFLTGEETLFTLPVGGWRLTATREGLQEGILIASRVLGSVGTLILLSLVTPAHRIFMALRWARIPHTWIETAMLMYRYIFTLLEQASNIFAAQQTRLGYTGLRRSLNSMGTLAGRVIDCSINQAARSHEAMQARGYNGIIPVGSLPALTARDIIVFIFFAIVMTMVYLLAEGHIL